jgi:hypothetical protein
MKMSTLLKSKKSFYLIMMGLLVFLGRAEAAPESKAPGDFSQVATPEVTQPAVQSTAAAPAIPAQETTPVTTPAATPKMTPAAAPVQTAAPVETPVQTVAATVKKVADCPNCRISSPPPLYSGQEGMGPSYGQIFDSPFTDAEKKMLKRFAAKEKLTHQELCCVNEILSRVEPMYYNHRFFFFIEELLQRDRHYRNSMVYEEEGWIYDPILQVSYSPFAQILLRYTNQCCGVYDCGNNFFIVNDEEVSPVGPLPAENPNPEKKV